MNASVVKPRSAGGAGFDATWTDGLRDTARAAIGSASAGASSQVSMDSLAGVIQNISLPNRWRAVQAVENHDLVYTGRGPRIAKLADGSNSRSWYARSRSRVAMGLVMTAPGIPLIFMGQEFLEDKQWSDTPNPANLIYWAGLDRGDENMGDFLRFTRELIALRRNQPALRGEEYKSGSGIPTMGRGRGRRSGSGSHSERQYLAQRSDWIPRWGHWREVFNSDAYDNWINPMVAGNGAGVDANGPPMHNLSNSAPVTIPANGCQMM